MRLRIIPPALATGLLAVLLMAAPAKAQRFEVQPALQAALFKKIIVMSAKAGDIKPTVLMVFDAQHEDDAAAMAKAFEDLGLTLQFARNGQMPSSFSGVLAAFMSAPNSEALRLCEENGVLTLSGYRGMVADGKAALTIVNEGGKPKPMINRRRLEVEKKADLAKTLANVSIVVE